MASLFVRAPGDDHLDITRGFYYAVWVGQGVGVYHDWWVTFSSCVHLLKNPHCRNDVVEAIAGWMHPKFAKRNTVEEAIVALVMKGANVVQSKATFPLVKKGGLNSAKQRQADQVSVEDIGEFRHTLRLRSRRFPSLCHTIVIGDTEPLTCC